VIVSITEAFVTLLAIVSMCVTIVIVIRLAHEHSRRMRQMEMDHEQQMKMLAQQDPKPPQRNMVQVFIRALERGER
jgi:hypothetical protein